MDLSTLSWRLVALAGLVLAAFVALSVAHVDTTQLVTLVLTLAGIGGVGVHQATRLDKQDRTLTKQDKALAKITEQTNGVLDSRIRAGVRAVMAEAGFIGDNPGKKG